MRTECLIGIDVGTSRIKAVAYDLRGKALASNIMHTRIVSPQPGWSHFESSDIVDAVSKSLAGLRCNLSGLRPLAIGVAAIGEAGFLVDEKGAVLYPAITWFDERTDGYRGRLHGMISESELFASSGMNPDHIYSLYKILWLRQNEPELFKRARRWLCMEDFVIYTLTGRIATDYTIASRTALFDRREKAWNRDLMGKLGLNPEMFAEVLPSGSPVAGVLPDVARRCDLPEDVPVCTGAHDHICAAFAVGMIDPGVLVDSIGTAEAIKTAVKHLPLDSKVMRGHFDCYPHVVDGYYVISGHNPASGAILEWVRREIRCESEPFFEHVSRLALAAPVGANGIVFLPFMAGSGTPHGNRGVRGAIYGLSTENTIGDLARAFFEGTSFWLLDNVHTIEDLIGRRIDRILVTGGGSESEAWLRVKADVMGRELIKVDLVETAALGAAFLAGYGAGVFSTALEAAHRIARLYRVIEPKLEAHRAYTDLFLNRYLPWKRVVLNNGGEHTGNGNTQTRRRLKVLRGSQSPRSC